MHTLDTSSAVTRDLLVPLALASDALSCNWRALLEEVPTGIFVARSGHFLFVNHRLAQMFGYAVPDMLNRVGSLDLAAPEFRQQVMNQVQERRVGSAEPPYDIQCLRQDGSRFDARISGMRVLIDGQEADLVALQDVSETLQAMRDVSAQASQLAEADKALRMSQFMLDHSPVPIVAVDTEGRLRYLNEATAHMLGHARQALLQLSIFDIAPHRRPDMWINSFETLSKIGSRVLPSDWRTADGRILPVELNATFMEYEAERYIVIYATDVTERMAVQEQALRLSSFDDVTGLPNRQFLQARLRSEGQLAVAEGRHIGLLAVEVNEVQQINEAMGYAVGDQLLMTLTRRMATGLKGTDTLAYMGDGEFVFLLTHQLDVNDDTALQLGRHLLDVLTDPIEVGSEQVQVSCDIGVVIFPQDAQEPDHVLRQAQSAMRMAEARGRNQICFYTPEANARVGEKLAMEAALRGAMDRQELCLVYQPQVDLTTGKVIGVEALARWHHPELGEVPATDFIALAEETGMIFPLGLWALKSACEMAVRWKGRGLPPLRMAVNLSPRQLLQAHIASDIEAILMQTGLDPTLLTIEIGEGMLMENLDQVSATLRNFKSIGIEIALDDFGVGYSSLTSLRRLPIDMIKIDRSLVPDVTADTEDVSITHAIITLAHCLDMKVLAVGVESDGELALLVANQCDQMQGFFFSTPLPEDELVSLMTEGRCLPESMLGRNAHKRTLLIVDDEENIVSSLRRLLRKDGYNIITANSGPQGLQRMAECNVDVILSDQRMPGMTGVEFLRRAKELYPHTIRMVLSGYTELQSITDAINEGAIYKFLTKPWDDDRVRAHIQEAFHQKEMADENRRLDHEVQEANRELAEVNGRLQRLLESQREQIHREETSLIIAREVLENIPAPVIGLDPGGTVAFMNPDAEALFEGAAPVLGLHVGEVQSGQLLALWQAADGQHHQIELMGQPFSGVCRAMTGEAKTRGALMVLTPLREARLALNHQTETERTPT